MLVMDINKQWQELEQAKFSNSHTNKEDIMNAIKKESVSTIAELKKRLKVKIMWIVFFIALFIGIACFNMQNIGVVTIMACATLCYAGGFIALYQEYKKMGTAKLFDTTALQSMQFNLDLIKSALKKEYIFGLITFPFAVLAGLMMSDLFKGLTLAESFDKMVTYQSVGTGIVIMIVVGYIAYRMNKVAFGKQINKLEEQISQLNSIA